MIILLGLLLLAIIIGGIAIAEWSFIAVKEWEHEQQTKGQTR